MRALRNGNSAEEGAKERLFAAGIDLFAEKGYASTSVREIVERAGVTKPVLYYYFKSKEGLFLTILDQAALELQKLLECVLEGDGKVLDRLIDLHREVYRAVEENPNLFRMIHGLVFGPPQGAPSYDFERYHTVLRETIKTIYARGLGEGEVKEEDPEEVSIFVLGLTDFCLHLDYLHPEQLDPERPVRLLRLAFEGLSKPLAS